MENNEKEPSKCGDFGHHNWKQKCWHGAGGGNGAVYGLGLIGAAVYFIGQAATFGAGVLGFLKALVWPAFLVYEAFKFLLGWN